MRQTSTTFSTSTPSRFLVLEGVNGAGKTSLQQRLSEYLRSRGESVVVTREPGATALGKTLRSLVLEHSAEAPCELSELFLFAADRAQHVEKVIRPALAAGSWVISDRYFYSTVAFQGYGRGIDRDIITQVNKLAVAGLYPAAVLLLDLDPLTGLRRAQSRQEQSSENNQDAFEKEAADFHRRIRNGFLEIAEQSEQAFVVVDATQSPDTVFDESRSVIDKLIAQLARPS